GSRNEAVRGHWGWIADVSEEVPAKQRCSGFLKHHLRLPAMRDMRGGHQANSFSAKIEDLALGKRSRRTVGKVANRNLAPKLTVDDLGIRSGLQPHVHSATFVRFN